MKLFYKAGACSLSIHIILLEANLNFTIEKVDLTRKITESGLDFLRINPKGQVPVLLLDDDSLLTESVAIMQYLSDLVPDINLLPKVGELTRYQGLAWLNYIATELHKGFTPFFNSKTSDEYKIIAREKLNHQFSYINSVLSQNHYILGNNFSVADVYLFNVLLWARIFKFKIQLHSNLVSWFDRIAARPAVIAALSSEGLA